MSTKRSFDDVLKKNISMLIPHGSKLILGLSGGVDSTVLLRILHEMRAYEIVAVHVNHGIRSEAIQDEMFCRNLCSELDIEICVHRVDIPAMASEHRVSHEYAGRVVRSRIYTEERERVAADFVVLGHHANDRIETFLYNLLRGTGIRGLRSIREHGSNGIVRPLLNFRKSDILHLAEQKGWSFVQDESNFDIKYDRNWIRNSLLPVIESRFQNFSNTALETSRRFSDLEDYVFIQLQEWLDADPYYLSSDKTSISLEAFNQTHRFLQGEILAELWKNVTGSIMGFNKKFVDQFVLWAAANRNGRTMEMGNKIHVINRNGRAHFSKPKSELDVDLTFSGSRKKKI